MQLQKTSSMAHTGHRTARTRRISWRAKQLTEEERFGHEAGSPARRQLIGGPTASARVPPASANQLLITQSLSSVVGVRGHSVLCGGVPVSCCRRQIGLLWPSNPNGIPSISENRY